MHGGCGGGWPQLVRFLRAGGTLDHLALRKQRDELHRGLRGRGRCIDQANQADDDDVEQCHQADPFPKGALLLDTEFVVRLERGTTL